MSKISDRKAFAVDGIVNDNFWQFQRGIKEWKRKDRHHQYNHLLKLTVTPNKAEDALFHSRKSLKPTRGLPFDKDTVSRPLKYSPNSRLQFPARSRSCDDIANKVMAGYIHSSNFLGETSWIQVFGRRGTT